MNAEDFPFVDPNDLQMNATAPPDPNSPAATPAIPPMAPPNPGVMSQWSQALADPTVRSSLLQFGISMMQPPSFGDNFASQFGRAVGSAGEAQSSREAEALKKQDTESKTTLREARAGAAESRAREAGSNLEVKKGMLQVQQDRLGISQILQGQRRHRDAVVAYNKYVQLLPPDIRFGDQKNIPSFQEWAVKNGFGDVASGPPSTVPGSSSTSTAPVNLQEERDTATRAIAQRPDRADAIRVRYKERTGQEADF